LERQPVNEPFSSTEAPTDSAWLRWQELFQASAGRWYAVLDAARDPEVLRVLRCSGRRSESLYSGPRAELLARGAPYLVAVPRGSHFQRQLWDHAWGESWGIFLASNAGFAAVRTHLRRLLRAVLPDGRKALFRFYDPRVLRVYLPSCSDDERPRFHGPITRFVCEHEDEAQVAVSAHDGGAANAPAREERWPIRFSNEQWAAFQEGAARDYVRRQREHVQRVYPDVVFGMSPDDVDRMIRGLIDEARGFGLTRRDTVGRFIAYRCELGRRFYEEPLWSRVGAILQDGTMSEREKVDRMDGMFYRGSLLPRERR
jgi:hypothetical protein